MKYYIADKQSMDTQCSYRIFKLYMSDSGIYSRGYSLCTNKDEAYHVQRKIVILGWRLWLTVGKYKSLDLAISSLGDDAEKINITIR